MSHVIKADLHYHGPIGLQPYWLKVQGYVGKNLLTEIFDACAKRDINLCAITSDEDKIPFNSIHDRFNWLKNKYAIGIRKPYSFDVLGKNVALMYNEYQNKSLYIVNGQTVRTREKEISEFDGLTKKGIADYLVIGTNQIPNHRPLEETVKRVYESGNCIGIAEHAFCTAHGGMDRDNPERLLPYIHAIEGHNSQLIFNRLTKLPIVGKKFAKYRRELNEEAQKYALQKDKPWIATSDGHRIEDVGISSITFAEELLDTHSEEKFVTSFNKIIVTKNFSQQCAYQNIFGWFDWTLKLQSG